MIIFEDNVGENTSVLCSVSKHSKIKLELCVIMEKVKWKESPQHDKTDGNLWLKSNVKVVQRLQNVAACVIFHSVSFDAFKCEVRQEMRRFNLRLTDMAGAVRGRRYSSSWSDVHSKLGVIITALQPLRQPVKPVRSDVTHFLRFILLHLTFCCHYLYAATETASASFQMSKRMNEQHT